MFTECRLPYGKAFLTARIPASNLSGILTARHVPGLRDEAAAILYALRHPLESRPLNECVNKNDKVVVIATDNTRACPDHKLLPVILRELETRTARENITIIVALGTHAPLNKEELIQKFGKDIVEKYDVINHDVRDTVNIGITSRGTPVEINRRVMEADFRISTGFIEPHFFAGFSGGRKSISPGTSGLQTIIQNHRYQMLNHPEVKAGVLKGNPVHEDMVEQARMAKLNFIVNVLLNQRQEITHVVAGHPVLAHEQGCEMEREIAQVYLDRKADITITTNSGAPLDLDFYQSCKGIDTASQITREGGIIIIASACHAGIGPEAFRDLHASCSGASEVLEKIRLSEPRTIWWENQILARAQINHQIYLVSDLEDKLVKEMKVTPIRSIEEGLGRAFKELGQDARVAVIPEGPMVLPLIKGE